MNFTSAIVGQHFDTQLQTNFVLKISDELDVFAVTPHRVPTQRVVNFEGQLNKEVRKA